MLDLDAKREGAPPKDAATLVIVRDAKDGAGLEVFCVERNKASRFMGGAIVFPGGKLDPGDREGWSDLVSGTIDASFAEDAAHATALAVAACRESLEEAAILPVHGGTVGSDDLKVVRAALKDNPGAMRDFLRQRGLRLDLGALVPFARWITPVAESRRFDARFFLVVAPEGQEGAHDEYETMASFWATPSEILRRFEAREVQLMPPTHRTIELLASCASAADARAVERNLAPVCPQLVQQQEGVVETLALVLPGDPEHDVKEVRVPGRSRYVLRGDRWRAEDAPR